MQRIIVTTLYFLTALLPLAFTTSTYELFEFPKFIILLSGTIIIATAWAVHMFQTRDFQILKPSAISFSLLAILLTQTLATLFSIHPYTSFWGYYSRFHQGLLTTICYTIIYFAAVKWLDTKSTQKLINISIKTAILISLIAILEHYNISITCMLMTALAKLQNAANSFIFTTACWGNLTNPLDRSFATLGQPNWLAAYLIPHLYLVKYQNQNRKHQPLAISHFFYYLLLFLALLFTNSRSGFIAFGLAYVTYWLVSLHHFTFAKIHAPIIHYSLVIIAASLLFGTPFTPSLKTYFLPTTNYQLPTTNSGTVLETVGSTGSGDIRKIVWEGTAKLIRRYPLLGTGPETFAYTYYWERPLAHNYTTEWDYLYNKAHNEYLNLAATTGLLGLSAYLYWHYAIFGVSLTRIPPTKKINKVGEARLAAFLPVMAATVVSFAITNFFGFSVIPVYFLMILISALPATLAQAPLPPQPLSTLAYPVTIALAIILTLLLPLRLLLADYYFTQGKGNSERANYTAAVPYLTKAVSFRPSEDLFHSYLSEAYANLASSGNYADLAVSHARATRDHNPYHLNYYKSRAKVYLALASLDPDHYRLAAQELAQARQLAPTDPKLAYNLGLVYSRLGDIDRAESELERAIALKKNYQEPYYALTLVYEQTNNVTKIPALLDTARTNLATYSGLLQEKMEKYTATP